jgi:hypothetical protein
MSRVQTPLRPELDTATMPDRMKLLPIDARGYPVPWFVAWVDGQPEFRAMDGAKWRQAVTERRCWVCGGILGKWLTFTIGPMCAINRTTAEPPSHTDCAKWSVRNCPFLSRPKMVRREDDTINVEVCAANVAGEMIARNPGVTLLWTTRTYTVYNDGHGKPLIEIGHPSAVSWYREGRPATRGEVEVSILTGLPLLFAACDKEDTTRARDSARAELEKRCAAVEALYPRD